MAQQLRSYIYAAATIGCVAGFSQPMYAQGWYGSPYGSQAPWMAPPPGYHFPPANAAPRHANNASGQERNAWQAQLATSQKQLQDTHNELQRTQMLLQQARAALEREQSSMHQRSSMQHTFSNQLTHLSSQQDEVYAQMRRLTDEVSALKAPLINNQAQIADIAIIARALSEERNRLQSNLDSQDDRLSALRAEIKTGRDALQQTRSDAAKIRDGLVKAELQVQSCETQISDTKARLQDAIYDSDTSQQALTNALTARDNLQTELSKCAVKFSQARTAQTIRPSSPGSASASARSKTVAMMSAETIPDASEGDNDGDGIPNSVDFCPETPDGIAVGPTGCDLPLPIVLEGVSFHSNSHQLNKNSFVVLDGVAGMLIRHPELKLEVADFTHTQGSAAFNRSLSQQRAETIREYLVSQGVDAGHLTAHGYGNERPVSDSNSPDPIRPGRPVTLRHVD